MRNSCDTLKSEVLDINMCQKGRAQCFTGNSFQLLPHWIKWLRISKLRPLNCYICPFKISMIKCVKSDAKKPQLCFISVNLDCHCNKKMQTSHKENSSFSCFIILLTAVLLYQTGQTVYLDLKLTSQEVLGVIFDVFIEVGHINHFLKKYFCKQKWLMCPINPQNPQQNDSWTKTLPTPIVCRTLTADKKDSLVQLPPQ